jgi:hypothetical protein
MVGDLPRRGIRLGAVGNRGGVAIAGHFLVPAGAGYMLRFRIGTARKTEHAGMSGQHCTMLRIAGRQTNIC